MNIKSTFKDYVKTFIALAITLGLMFGLFMLVLALIDDPKTPATIEQVKTIIENSGFDPIDSTDIYNNAWHDQVGNIVTESVSFVHDDISFNYFIFNSDASAEMARKKSQSYIRSNRYGTPNIEISECVSNYMIYTLDATSKGLYSVNIRVGNTLVYAYCNSENKSEIQKILLEIDYL